MIDFSYRELTLDNLKQEVSDESIWHFLIPNFEKVGKAFKHRDEDSPSSMIKYSRNKLWFKDFGKTHKALDWIGYLKEYHNLSFVEALKYIRDAFGLKLGDYSNNKISKKPVKIYQKEEYKEAEFKIIRYKERKWDDRDTNYWTKKYALTESFLRKAKVYPISHFWINDTMIESQKDKPTYVYVEGIYRKIYSPLDKIYKWISNCTKDVIFGLHLLPSKIDYIIITSSYKDSLSLTLAGFNSIPVASENSFIPIEIYDKIIKKDIKILLLFDNDKPGINNAKTFKKQYDIELCFMPIVRIKNKVVTKDPSDYLEYFGLQKLNRYLNKTLKKIRT